MAIKFHLFYQLAMMGALDVLPQLVRDQSLPTRARNRMQSQAVKAASRIAQHFNGALFQDTPDRVVLETRILPYLQLDDSVKCILFIGCDWYTAGYARLFAHKEFWTMDPDAARANYGAPRHQVAPMHTMRSLVRNVDALICNGVIGWGLDDRDEAEASFAAAYDVLNPGGHLVLGFNDRPPHKPFEPEDLPSIRRLQPAVFPPLGASEYRVDHELCHVYRFYRKPLA